MDIGAMRHRIKIQKSEVIVDAVGNHISSWTDFYSCWAEVNKASGREYGVNPETISEDTLVFRVRWCSKISALNSKEYRIIFDGAVFDIYMQSKIMSSLEQVRDLKNKILQLDAVLNKM